MSRISAPHIGIEQLTEVGEHHRTAALPERYVLPPDGRSIETHLDNLYPADLAGRRLLAFACPTEGFDELLRPQAFRHALKDLEQQVRSSDVPELQAALALLQARNEDEYLLQMALHLLHKV
ncbi:MULTISPECIES: YscX family type III secretion protein [Pseudomonas]|uniref:Type III secretion protein, YscX family n=2 Tax=Pseudomonas fluorescens group TaxID=136843 RepID=A0A423LHN4_PSEFL|nr:MULTISPECIES: YscX family type III secretion protein [Pseudomonas]MDR9860962.1 YscX family type III secretion protein [Pseudomonas baetica]PKA70714.1 type III secretion protein X [Pseudomonas baetica]PTC16287.1 YscX family type III secretion protein [Pseudomonas baetica]RON67807.1 type III secretion protein, YscX family [Pseudomonas fluorescens]